MAYWGLAQARAALEEARNFDWSTVHSGNAEQTIRKFFPGDLDFLVQTYAPYGWAGILFPDTLEYGGYANIEEVYEFKGLMPLAPSAYEARFAGFPQDRYRTTRALENAILRVSPVIMIAKPRPGRIGHEVYGEQTFLSTFKTDHLGRNIVTRLLSEFIEYYTIELKREFREAREDRQLQAPADRLSRRERAELLQKIRNTGFDQERLENVIETSQSGKSTAPATANIEAVEVVHESDHASRRWGIEIELAGARGVRTPDDWEDKEDCSLRSAYLDWGVSDCGCEGDECDWCEDGYHTDCDWCMESRHDDTREFVSPPMTQAFSEGIVEICDDARYEPQNDSAGVHVHVEANDLTPRQVGALIFAYSVIEPLLTSSYQRETTEYCHPLTARRATWQMRQIRETRNSFHGTQEAILGSLSGERYQTVNVNALGAHGTIEFRGMGPVYNAEYLHKWARFCREMVNCAKNNAPGRLFQNARSFDDVLTIFARYGEETIGVRETVAA